MFLTVNHLLHICKQSSLKYKTKFGDILHNTMLAVVVCSTFQSQLDSQTFPQSRCCHCKHLEGVGRLTEEGRVGGRALSLSRSCCSLLNERLLRLETFLHAFFGVIQTSENPHKFNFLLLKYSQHFNRWKTESRKWIQYVCSVRTYWNIPEHCSQMLHTDSLGSFQ